MEKLLQPLKQEGFTEEIWKSLTTAPEAETDILSDGEPRPSPHHSPPTARGTKRTADGERKDSWGGSIIEEEADFHQVKVQSPPAAMPPEARADGTDDEEDDFKPRMYFHSKPR
jgi:hypothetical protein